MEEEKKAYSYAIKLLTGRDYSKVKLAQKMRERDFSNESIRLVIEELERQNFIREDLYIEARIKGFMFKRCSPQYIAQKMAQESLSVDLELIEKIFSEYGQSTELQISELIRKKIPSRIAENQTREEKDKIRNRVLRYLLNKGHSFSQSQKLLDSYLKQICE